MERKKRQHPSLALPRNKDRLLLYVRLADFRRTHRGWHQQARFGANRKRRNGHHRHAPLQPVHQCRPSPCVRLSRRPGPQPVDWRLVSRHTDETRRTHAFPLHEQAIPTIGDTRANCRVVYRPRRDTMVFGRRCRNLQAHPGRKDCPPHPPVAYGQKLVRRQRRHTMGGHQRKRLIYPESEERTAASGIPTPW